MRVSTIGTFATAVSVVVFGMTQIAAADYAFVKLYSTGALSGQGHMLWPGPGGQAAGYLGSAGDSTTHHAAIWNSSSPIDLHPSGMAGIDFSNATFTNGAQQVGYGASKSGSNEIDHAMLWNNTAASAVDLHPASLSTSVANGTDGIHQVGSGVLPQQVAPHALLWSGTSASAIDLNPTTLFGANTNSQAFGVDGAHQVGSARLSLDFTQFDHAVLWTGTADSAIDLQPANSTFNSTQATAVSGNQQVGSGTVAPFNTINALMWNGSANTMVDLQPAVFAESAAYGTNGTQQVGYARTSASHAVVWSGSADSMVDLTTFMPVSPIADPLDPYYASNAVSIDAAGNIFGFANDLNGNSYAVEWAVTPEPSILGYTAIGLIAALRRRRQTWRPRS